MTPQQQNEQANAQLQAATKAIQDAEVALQQGRITDAQYGQLQQKQDAALQNYLQVTRTSGVSGGSAPYSLSGPTPTPAGAGRPGQGGSFAGDTIVREIPASGGWQSAPYTRDPMADQPYTREKPLALTTGGQWAETPYSLSSSHGTAPANPQASPGVTVAPTTPWNQQYQPYTRIVNNSSGAPPPPGGGAPPPTDPYGGSSGGGVATAASGGAQSGGGAFNLPVRMTDGSVRNFSAMDQSLVDAINQGGLPLDIYDQPMKVTPGVYGGFLVTDSKGQAMPLNVAGGQNWLPGQKEAMTNYFSAGWTPGSEALRNPPSLPPSAAGSTGADNGSPFDFGYLSQTFDEQFKGPGEFKPPTDLSSDPGYQFRMKEAQKALGAKFSAGGYLNSGKAFKELDRYTQDIASQEYGAAYARDKNLNDTNWDKSMSEYAQRRSVFDTNRGRIFNQFSTVAGTGQVAANSTANYGLNYGQQAGDNTIGAANARSSATMYANQAQRDAWDNSLDTAYDAYALSRMGRR